MCLNLFVGTGFAAEDAHSNSNANPISGGGRNTSEALGNTLPDKPRSENDAWTICIYYMCGSDLESNGSVASVDLLEMLDFVQMNPEARSFPGNEGTEIGESGMLPDMINPLDEYIVHAVLAEELQLRYDLCTAAEHSFFTQDRGNAMRQHYKRSDLEYCPDEQRRNPCGRPKAFERERISQPGQPAGKRAEGDAWTAERGAARRAER